MNHRSSASPRTSRPSLILPRPRKTKTTFLPNRRSSPTPLLPHSSLLPRIRKSTSPHRSAGGRPLPKTPSRAKTAASRQNTSPARRTPSSSSDPPSSSHNTCPPRSKATTARCPRSSAWSGTTSASRSVRSGRQRQNAPSQITSAASPTTPSAPPTRTRSASRLPPPSSSSLSTPATAACPRPRNASNANVGRATRPVASTLLRWLQRDSRARTWRMRSSISTPHAPLPSSPRVSSSRSLHSSSSRAPRRSRRSRRRTGSAVSNSNSRNHSRSSSSRRRHLCSGTAEEAPRHFSTPSKRRLHGGNRPSCRSLPSSRLPFAPTSTRCLPSARSASAPHRLPRRSDQESFCLQPLSLQFLLSHSTNLLCSPCPLPCRMRRCSRTALLLPCLHPHSRASRHLSSINLRRVITITMMTARQCGTTTVLDRPPTPPWAVTMATLTPRLGNHSLTLYVSFPAFALFEKLAYLLKLLLLFILGLLCVLLRPGGGVYDTRARRNPADGVVLAVRQRPDCWRL